MRARYIEGIVCENGSYTPPVMWLCFNHRGTEDTEKCRKEIVLVLKRKEKKRISFSSAVPKAHFQKWLCHLCG